VPDSLVWMDILKTDEFGYYQHRGLMYYFVNQYVLEI